MDNFLTLLKELIPLEMAALIVIFVYFLRVFKNLSGEFIKISQKQVEYMKERVESVDKTTSIFQRTLQHQEKDLQRLYELTERYKQELKDARDIALNLGTLNNEAQRETLSKDLSNQLQIAYEVQTAYELLLIPGYDISLISDILEYVISKETIDPVSLASPRKITSITVEMIVDSMVVRNLIKAKGKGFVITEQGNKLLDGLRHYLRPSVEISDESDLISFPEPKRWDR